MNKGTLFWGGLLVLIGFLLLLDNLGFFGDVNIWGIIWPLFLIVIGAWILWGYRFRSQAKIEHESIALDGCSRARIHVHHGAGRLTISGHDTLDVLVEGDFGGGLDVSTRQEGDLKDVKLSVPVQFVPFSWYPGYSLDWNFSIQKGVPISLDLNTGASDSQIDLSSLQVYEIKLNSGASSTRIDLPSDAGTTKLTVEAGAATVDIRVPPGVAARVRSRGGLSSLELDKTRFLRTGDGYQSADYESAPNKADISIQMGAGSVGVH